MRNRLQNIMVMSLTFQGFVLMLSGQSAFNPDHTEWASTIREKLTIFTDRSLYLSDEFICFRADITADVLKGESWSTVLYVELMTSSGESIARGKYPINENIGTGELQIPIATLTGNYFLKCYTKWMRNFRPEEFGFVPLRIINPNRVEVEESSTLNRFTSGLSRLLFNRDIIDCQTDSPSYGKGDQVSLRISVPPEKDPGKLIGCITVAPSGTIDTVSGQVLLREDPIVPEDFELFFLPDLGRGPSISGIVVNTFNKPIQQAQVFFSILGPAPDLLSTITDMNGKYGISLPYRVGSEEIYVGARSDEVITPLVKVDPEFDVSKVSIPFGRFRLTDSEKEICARMFLNLQFAQTYGIPVEESSTITNDYPFHFYGSDITRLDLNEYVTLPNLEEVFFNLVPSIIIEKQRGLTYMRLRNWMAVEQIAPPLLLIDNVPIFDHRAILALPAEMINHIDIIDMLYIKGDLMFGGIISIFSREGNLAGIELPASSFFFDFLSFQISKSGHGNSKQFSDHLPDFKNTILWLNNIELDCQKKPAKLSFAAPVLDGDYVVLVRSLSDSGEVLSSSTVFRVE